MPLRVISGSARGIRLKSVPGDHTRPIMDRVKESLFNILGNWVRGSRWIDMFAGTGSVGIEALSRGAEYCLFLDNNRAAVETIRENLRITQLNSGAVIRQVDALKCLSGRPSEAERVEVIYVAPPQYHGLWKRAIEILDYQSRWLLPDGIVIAQLDPTEFEPLQLVTLRSYDQRRYGNTMLCFYETPGN